MTDWLPQLLGRMDDAVSEAFDDAPEPHAPDVWCQLRASFLRAHLGELLTALDGDLIDDYDQAERGNTGPPPARRWGDCGEWLEPGDSVWIFRGRDE